MEWSAESGVPIAGNELADARLNVRFARLREPGDDARFRRAEVHRTGIFWWEPMVAHRPSRPGGLRSRGMVDEKGNALPVMRVFDRWTRGKVPQNPPAGG